VLGAGVTAMGQGHIAAAIGPCIGPCCYPVDDALRATMAQQFGDDVVAGDAVDLRRAARRALAGAGVDDAAITDVPGCTSCDDERFFSYRRDGAGTGRQAGVIWLVDA
jgi:copper oxidase (laccase) domain-containing protein